MNYVNINSYHNQHALIQAFLRYSTVDLCLILASWPKISFLWMQVLQEWFFIMELQWFVLPLSPEGGSVVKILYRPFSVEYAVHRGVQHTQVSFLSQPSGGGLMIEIVYKPFFAGHFAHSADRLNDSYWQFIQSEVVVEVLCTSFFNSAPFTTFTTNYCHCHQKVGGWWKSTINPFPTGPVFTVIGYPRR